MTLIVSGQSEAIERLVALSKFATGAAASKLVLEALSTPSLYVFAELRDSPNVKSLAEDPNLQKFLHLLDIFSVKTLKAYKESESGLPPLNEAQLKKLKQLTLVELASKNKLLSYSSLLNELEMNNVRELEDLIIESIFVGIIVGKLNQKSQCFEVQNVMARDVIPEQYSSLLSSLKKWKYQCDAIVANIDEQKKFLRDGFSKKQQAFESFSCELEANQKKLANAPKAGKQNQIPPTGANRGKKRQNLE